MTKEELLEILLEHFEDESGIINLSNLDFGEKEVDLENIKAKYIHNTGQKAKFSIYNKYQQAKNIYNERQKATEIIRNNEQKAEKNIHNMEQEAKNNIHNDNQKGKKRFF